MTRPLLPAACPLAARPPQPIGWRLSVLGAAIAVALGLASTDASALALGQIKVQSALGEPLRAEVDVTEITAVEADSLKIRVASADAFRTAGVSYNPALADLSVTLQRRADGQYVVRLRGARPLNDPFIDLLLEADAASGRIVRDYTLLLDPPAGRDTATGSPIAPIAPLVPVTPVAPQFAMPAQRPVQAPRRVHATLGAPQPGAVTATAAAAPPAPPVPSVAPPVAVTALPPRSGGSEQQVTVQRGDTAGRLAAAYKPAEISLDQMLVALLRANPDAFVGGNVNRMKSGAVLDLPSPTDAGAVPAAEAHRTIIAQSRDFSAYRQRLAENAPTSNVAVAGRRASGKLQASVEDRNAASASPDKLTISQGNAAARAADEKLAQTRQAQESSNRVAELSKNIAELNKLKSAASAGPAATTSTAAPGAASAVKTPAVPGIPVATPATIAPVTPTPTASVSPAPAGAATAPSAATTAASAAGMASPATAASAAAAAPRPALKPAPGPAPVERGFFAELRNNPLMLAAAALIALLVAFLIYRVLGRRKREEVGESVFLESRIPKDSFFGASGGELVDTRNRGDSTVSSLSYSPSQLDAGDVDPVAEADVYLAYGRDLQAEEILREALRVNPDRTAIHLKLLEIHAKRRDVRAYESLAAEVHKLTGGTGSDWHRVVEMGKELDPGNPLYDSAAPRHVSAAESAAFASALAVAAKPAAAGAAATAPPPAFVPSVAPLDFDLDLSQPPAPAATSASAPASSYTPPAPVGASLPPAAPRALSPASRAASPAPAAVSSFDLENDFDTAPGALNAASYLTPEPEFHAGDTHTRPASMLLPSDSGFIEFDMSAMADLNGRQQGGGAARPLSQSSEEDESPHAIKLSLARELQAIGDVEGARSLVEEVEAESAGELKLQAKQLLAELG